MDIQQLTLIISLIKDLADGAMMGFILYLVVVHVLPYFVGVMALFFIYKAIKMFLSIWTNESWFKEQAEYLGQQWVYCYGDPDLRRTKDLIVRALHKDK